MQQKKIKELIARIAEKQKMSPDAVTEICKAPLEFVAEVIANESDREHVKFPSVRITGFGVFYCKPGRREFFRKLNEKERLSRLQPGGVQFNSGETSTGDGLQGEDSSN